MLINQLVLIALCGVGTFLLRYVPMRMLVRRGQQSDSAEQARWQRWLAAVGPAAIMALLVVSCVPMLTTNDRQTLAVVVGLSTVWLVRRVTGSLGLAVICSACAYGVLMHLWSL